MQFFSMHRCAANNMYTAVQSIDTMCSMPFFSMHKIICVYAFAKMCSECTDHIETRHYCKQYPIIISTKLYKVEYVKSSNIITIFTVYKICTHTHKYVNIKIITTLSFAQERSFISSSF